MRALVLVSDAYGGRGGIASYNRYLLQALCEYPGMEHVLAIPRVVSYAFEPMPANLDYWAEYAQSKLKYLYACLRAALLRRNIDLIICSHIHLLPFAHALGLVFRCPVVPVIYGEEAWKPTPHRIVNSLCKKLRRLITIRRYTARCLMRWTGLAHVECFYLPTCIDKAEYGLERRSRELARRYGIEGRTVIMTAGRLDETNKGFDEVIDALPDLRKRIPNVSYLIMGDGKDKDRLLAKARSLGVADLVVFTGYVPGAAKADHYRLADVFAMPGSSPGFDRYPFRYVFLEALACGVPVVGCKVDDPEEVNDPDSQLIIQVDPKNRAAIVDGILAALSLPKDRIDPRLSHFYFGAFRTNLHRIVSEVLSA